MWVCLRGLCGRGGRFSLHLWGTLPCLHGAPAAMEVRGTGHHPAFLVCNEGLSGQEGVCIGFSLKYICRKFLLENRCIMDPMWLSPGQHALQGMVAHGQIESKRYPDIVQAVHSCQKRSPAYWHRSCANQHTITWTSNSLQLLTTSRSAFQSPFRNLACRAMCSSMKVDMKK